MIRFKYQQPVLFVLPIFIFLWTGAASGADVSGAWQGSWTMGSDSGSLVADLTQSGTLLSGSISIFNTPCGTFRNLFISGSVIGNDVRFNNFSSPAFCPQDGANYTLNFFSFLSGNTISGSFDIYANGVWEDSGAFELNRIVHIITAIAGAGGSIDPSGSVSVNDGADQTFQIMPNAGYQILDVMVDGASVGGVSSYTFTDVSSAHTIETQFISIPYMPWIPLLLLDE